MRELKDGAIRIDEAIGVAMQPSGSLRGRVNVALAAGHLPQLRYQRNGRYAACDGVILSAYDVPGPIFNTAAVLEPETPERALDVARAFFGTDRGWGVLVEADAGHPIEAELRARRWRVIQETPAMVLPVMPSVPSQPAGLEIRRVVDDAGLRDYLGPLGEVALPPAVGHDVEHDEEEALVPANVNEILIPSLAIALDVDVALFVGYVDGRPAGTAALYRTDGIAEIGGVAVGPRYRRRGFGTALTWAAIAEGAARGCDAAALHATAMGYPVYLAMGFVAAGNHRRYTAPG